ncbi:MAG: hypothetical protein L0K86_21475, partial [Actinomycetia bacterium]|nr:hypothetical protein [Actinomycetes bacterium]
ILTSRGTQARQLGTAPRAGAKVRKAEVAKARKAARSMVHPYGAALEVRVSADDAEAAAEVVREHASGVRVARSGETATVYVPAGRHASADPAGWVRVLPDSLNDAGVEPLSIDTP